MKATIQGAIIVMVVVFVMAVYGSVQLYFRADTLDLIESLQAENAELKDKVYWLRQANAMSMILEQLLTPCQIDELKLGNAKIEQEKAKEHKRANP